MFNNLMISDAYDASLCFEKTSILTPGSIGRDSHAKQTRIPQSQVDVALM